MTLDLLQKKVDQLIRSTEKGYFPEIENMVKLQEEVGELSSIYVRRYGSLKPKPTDDISDKALLGEMGDTLFVLICLANQAGIQLESALESVFEKFQTRDKSRHNL